MVNDIDYNDGLVVFIVLGLLWSVSFELAVIVGFSWAIAGINKSNKLKENYYENN